MVWDWVSWKQTFSEGYLQAQGGERSNMICQVAVFEAEQLLAVDFFLLSRDGITIALFFNAVTIYG